MQSWKARLGLMLAMLAMLLMVSVPVAVADDGEWDDLHGLSEKWDDNDEGDEEEEDWEEELKEDWEDALDEEIQFTVVLEVECEIDEDGDGLGDWSGLELDCDIDEV
ncbi:MAG TPA: hypothetical protein VNA27_02480 [Rubrobacteraceae bacterium]|nr:hypothetical protein [Rubrobacteraceae bacterium]